MILIPVCVCIGTILLILFVYRGTGTSRKNIDTLIKKGKFTDALSYIREKEKNGAISQEMGLVEKGRIYYGLMNKRLNKEEWRKYGQNEHDWINLPEAEKAETYFKQVLAVNPQNFEALYFLGMIYLNKGWYKEAKKMFRKALKVDKGNIEIRVNLAVIFVDEKEYGRAEQALISALKIDPKNPAATKNLFFLYRFYLDDPQKSIVYANRFLNLDTRDYDNLYIQEQLLTMIQRYPEYSPKEPMKWKEFKKFKKRSF